MGFYYIVSIPYRGRKAKIQRSLEVISPQWKYNFLVLRLGNNFAFPNPY